MTNSIPMPNRRRDWIRTVRRPAKKETKKMSSVIGQEADAGRQRAVAQVVLDVERQVQEHGEDRRRQAEGHRREPDEGRDLEQAEVEHRVRAYALVDEEGRP